jgi:hypothetical protein
MVAPDVVDFSKCTSSHLGSASITSRNISLACGKNMKTAPIPYSEALFNSFLGMLNYYHRFLSNVFTKLETLHKLHRHGFPGSGHKNNTRRLPERRNCCNPLTSLSILTLPNHEFCQPIRSWLTFCCAETFWTASTFSITGSISLLLIRYLQYDLRYHDNKPNCKRLYWWRLLCVLIIVYCFI